VTEVRDRFPVDRNNERNKANCYWPKLGWWGVYGTMIYPVTTKQLIAYNQ